MGCIFKAHNAIQRFRHFFMQHCGVYRVDATLGLTMVESAIGVVIVSVMSRKYDFFQELEL
jgi:hypothetical protein